MVRSPPKAPYINSGPPDPNVPNRYRGRSYLPGLDWREFYPREDEYGHSYPPYTGPLGTYEPGYVLDPRSRTPSTLQTAYQRYVAEKYGPNAKSHTDTANFSTSFAKGLSTGYDAGGAGGGGAAGRKSASAAVYAGTANDPRLYENTSVGAGLSGGNVNDMSGNRALFDAISHAEGTTKNGYNEVLGSGAYGRPTRALTEMTLQEVHDFGRNTLFAGQRARDIPENKLSSASGRYQITGTTMKEMANRLGLDMSTTKFTPEIQDRMALEIAKTQGLSAWEGFKTKAGQKYKTIAANALAGASYPGRSAASTDVAQLQRDLNAKGANLKVDGIAGPLTRAAQQKYSGTTYASTTQDEGRVPTAGQRAPAPVQVSSAGVPGLGTPNLGATRGLSIGPGPARVAPNVPQTPYYSNPYTSSTGGASAISSQSAVPTTSYTSGRGDEGRGVPSPLSMNTRNMQVPTQTFPAYDVPMRELRPVGQNQWSQLQGSTPAQRGIPVQSSYTSGRGDEGRIPAAGVQGPVPQTPRTPQPRPTLGWSQLQQPYPIQQAPVIAPAVVQTPTARIPQPRPEQAVPTAPAANWTLADIQHWADQHGIPVSKAAGVLSDLGSRVGNAVSSGGMGQSFSGARNSGLGYVGGRGYGGGSINQGVGGSINPNR